VFQAGEDRRIATRFGSLRENDIIAAVFAFATDNIRNPPDGGVIEQKTFDRFLRQVHQIVQAPDVREFVGQEKLDLIGGQIRETAKGKQDRGPEESGDYRHIDTAGFEKSHRAAHANSPRERYSAFTPFGGAAGLGLAAQASNCEPASGASEIEKDGPGEPEGHEGTHRLLNPHVPREALAKDGAGAGSGKAEPRQMNRIRREGFRRIQEGGGNCEGHGHG
jgi:hypothetical protein